jgi:prophage regulatory protein
MNLLKNPAINQKFGGGASRAKIHVWRQNGLWPEPVRLGSKSVAWPEHEVDAIIAARIAGKSDDEIRELVKQLEAQRTNAA